MKKHFVFSYANILIREIERKKYFSFFRRIFGLIYKLIINLLKRITNQIVNLDKKNNSEYFNLSLHELFKYFNSDKGKTLEVDNQNKTIKTHNYTIFYNKYFKNLKKKKY